MGHSAVISEIPLVPDGEQAREWAVRELADPIYQAAQPTWFDRAAQTVRDALASLLSPEVSPEWAAILALIAAVVVIAIVVVATIVWGIPRRRSARARAGGELFGDVDYRTADGLRSAAAAAERAGDWDTAIVLRFRAAARGLDERGVLELPPGTTARRFATRAGELVPDVRQDIADAATVFEDVRYLQRRGTPHGCGVVARADEALARAHPARLSEAQGAAEPGHPMSQVTA